MYIQAVSKDSILLNITQVVRETWKREKKGTITILNSWKSMVFEDLPNFKGKCIRLAISRGEKNLSFSSLTASSVSLVNSLVFLYEL